MTSISARVDHRKNTSESRAPHREARMYPRPGMHQSSLISRIWSEFGRPVLNGGDEIRSYAARDPTRYARLHFEFSTTTEESVSIVVEERRRSGDRDNPAYGLELIDWSGRLIIRVFHF
jgi:hypothetical protein